MVRFILICSLIIFCGIALVFAQQGQKVDLIPLDFGISQSVVSVNTTATPLPSTPLAGRKSILIRNLDNSTVVYIGSSNVTSNTNTTGGFPLESKEVFKGDIGENTIIYGIVASSTANVSVLEAR